MNYFKKFVCLIAVIWAMVNVADCFMTGPEIGACVASQNKLRALHLNTSPLEWDDVIAEIAQEHSDALLATHQDNGDFHFRENKEDFGENVYMSDDVRPGTCPAASLTWYNEIENYDFATVESKNVKSIGNFTQLVWKGTSRIGVGISVGKSSAILGNVVTYIVALYSPKGNKYNPGTKLQKYSVNVQPRIQGASTPSLKELDPSSTLKMICKNNLGDKACFDFHNNRGYKCNGPYQQYFRINCYKFCGYC